MLMACAVCAPVARAQDAGNGGRDAGSAQGSRTVSERVEPTRRRRPARRVRRAVNRAPAVTLRHTTPRNASSLAHDLGFMLSSLTRSGSWGILVTSLTRGDTLYSFNPDVPLQPASNMKLYTAALALDRLGANHRFTTRVLRTGTLHEDGTLQGDLILRGGGDPALSARFLGGGPSAAVDLLAQLVAGAGVTRVRGSLIADASAFDAELVPAGWESRYLQSGYAARVSALSLNENLLWIVVKPAGAGQAPLVYLDPASEISLINNVRTTAGRRDARVIFITRPDGRIEARGWIGSRAGEKRYQLVVEDPAAFTAGAFRRALAAKGIIVEGETRFGATPVSATPLTALPSPPLADLLSVMNRESINHYAELIFRNVAWSEEQPGSAQAANTLLQRFLVEKVGATPGSVSAADGSGLSIFDRSTARALVQLLDYAHRAPWSDAFHASLPVAGESELLRQRMRRTPAQGNLHAKTGTTNSVISLGGYVTAENGELLGFAFIYNGSDRWNARVTIDAMGATLAGFRRD
jgi:D-alanyl-D-alanine carboxypeptidase/D-alanyl-D-alanine-endopeptidase (penicillin-binding protein 4)